MAKYWKNQNNLVVSNILPGSTVGVWELNEEGEIRDKDEAFFIGHVYKEELKLSVPVGTRVLVRIRKYELKSFETMLDTQSENSVAAVQIRDMW